MKLFARVIASAFLSVALSTSFASAGILKTEKGTRSVEGVNISRSAEATLHGKSETLGTVGQGFVGKRFYSLK